MVIQNPEEIIFEPDTVITIDKIEFSLTDEQINVIYNRIFGSLKSRLYEHQEQELHKIR